MRRITVPEAREIREIYWRGRPRRLRARGGITLREIAYQYGCGRGVVFNVVHGREGWEFLGPDPVRREVAL